MTPTIRCWRSTSLGAEELEPSCSSAIRRVRAQAPSPRAELEKGEQPRRQTAEGSLIARLAAHESWARTADPSARTEPARHALLDHFERHVDPDGLLPPAERARRAGHARKAYFAPRAAVGKGAAESVRRQSRSRAVEPTRRGPAGVARPPSSTRTSGLSDRTMIV
jgi:hypothetical protein